MDSLRCGADKEKYESWVRSWLFLRYNGVYLDVGVYLAAVVIWAEEETLPSININPFPQPQGNAVAAHVYGANNKVGLL